MRTQPTSHPSDNFATRNPVTYRTIAAQVEDMKISALTPTEYPDVVVMLEYMRDQALAQHKLNELAQQKLGEREHAVTRRENDLALRALVLEAAIKTKETLGSRVRRYLGGSR